MQKKILFIPTYTYLTSPIYEELLSKLDDFEVTYLEKLYINNDANDQLRCKGVSKKFKEKFFRYIELELDTKEDKFYSKIRNFFILYKFQKNLKNIIKNIKPDIIVTGSDIKLSVRSIKKYFPNLPIIILQTAPTANGNCLLSLQEKIKYIIFNKIFGLCFFAKQKCIFKEYSDTYILLWGEYFKSGVGNNHDISKVKIVGNIKFDKFALINTKSKESKKKFFKINNIKGFSSVVTICTNSIINLEVAIIQSVMDLYIKIILENKNIFFVIKPHPREDINKIEQIFQSEKLENMLVTTSELYDVYKYTDVHISSFSTTASEAMAAGIPIIIVNPNNMIKADFYSNDIGEHVTNFAQLNDILSKTLSIEYQDNFFKKREIYGKKLFYKLDGKASERVKDIIVDTLK